MLLTAEEAKDKACCKQMLCLPENKSYFPEAKGRLAVGTCLSSRCMAWRWAISHTPLELQDLENPATPVGFCGLAGRPEGAV